MKINNQEIRIVDFASKYKADFARLNYEWIHKYFKVEDSDRKSLDHPQENIINPGGHIFMAELNGEVVGTCALIKMDDKRYELAKMGVSPKAQGLGIGRLLGQAIIQKARELGAEVLYLESNTVLVPAINLYYKLGFKKVEPHDSPYARCNIQMELDLQNEG